MASFGSFRGVSSSFNSSSSSSGSHDDRMPAELDEKVAHATVSLLNRSLDRVVGLADHWALLFDFTGTKFWVIIEGVQEGGKLVPVYTVTTTKPEGSIQDTRIHIDKEPSVWGLVKWVWPVNVVKNAYALVFQNMPYFGKGVRISPKQLRELAESNKLNNSRYDVLFNNCQTWAEVAANMLVKYKIT